ncbi:MAG TPA: ABC transporter permease [Chitinophagaceae bacterium]|jgi:predicted permease|nr:ABC transporter permease [Chitinophagaceae bacterium]
MFKNHVKIAWRNLLKDRQFTLLNVLGLSAGLACALLIFLWVNDERSYDKFFANDNQVYQVMEDRKSGGDIKVSDESSGLVSEILKAQMPQVQYAASLAPPEWFQKFTLSVGDKNIKAKGQYAGKDYFNIFSFKLLEGDKNKVLADKSSIAISDELAKKLFGTTENIIGKPVDFQHDTTFFVSGVFEKIPSHSSQQFDFVLSFDYYFSVQSWVKTWGNTGPHNFVLLRKGTDINAFNKKIAGVIAANANDTTRSLFAAKFSDNYLLNSFDHGSKVGSKIIYVRLFSLIAIFILVIACINFMNLSTAKASRRMKEVGIKKVVGASRKQLIFQFLSESIMVTLLAMVFAVLMVWLLLPSFNQLTGKQISLTPDPNIIGSFLVIALIAGLLAGSYPALYLSKFKPLLVLKGKLNTSIAEALSRKGLVVFQFAMSSVLIVAVIIIYQQVQFIQSTNPGYNKENIVRFDSEGNIQGKEDQFIEEMKKIPGVVNASFTFNNMIGRNFGVWGIGWEGKDPNEDIYFEGFGAGYDFIETMDMQMKEGRSFSRNYGDDYSKVLLNEAAIKAMHLKNPVGKIITVFGDKRQVIGIVKDFHFESLHEAVKPAYFTLQENPGKNPWFKIMVRIKATNQQKTIAAIQHLYESFNPGFPFTFNFLSEAYQKQYDTETRIATLSKYFAGLAIIISCLGLFGLAAFTAQKRRKEIGVRKVIGASVTDITKMLSKDFLRLVMIALCIAFPASWWLMNNWLQGFAYRVNINASVFFMAGVSIILITLFTISYQAIKAALANPVKSLRTE